jgi:hypothetical protein
MSFVVGSVYAIGFVFIVGTKSGENVAAFIWHTPTFAVTVPPVPGQVAVGAGVPALK